MLFIDPSVVKENHTVVDHGIDSLLAAEFRTWLNSSFGKNISMLKLMDARSSIGSIAQVIVEEAIGA
jgi:acyl carrier protein